MLSRIDEIIYPNRCEVIEIEHSQRYIYPIYKNGRSSLLEYTRANNKKTLFNDQIKKLQVIDVVLRNPQDRFISGVNTFLWMTKRDHPYLDDRTILHFAENYLFLNRHYAPQITWLINLVKYTNKDTQLKFHGMDYINEITNTNLRPDKEEQLLQLDDITRLKNNPHNEIYLRIDNILMSLIGQSFSMREIVEYIKNQDNLAYQKLSCIALD
jgi:hypothetical protein